jgi:hypothetical protein
VELGSLVVFAIGATGGNCCEVLGGLGDNVCEEGEVDAALLCYIQALVDKVFIADNTKRTLWLVSGGDDSAFLVNLDNGTIPFAVEESCGGHLA